LEITGTYDLNIPQQKVWDAMMEPDVLTDCIPACQAIEKHTSDYFYAKVKVRFGFVPVRFNVKVRLSNLIEPEKYSLEAEGEGGLVHAAKATGEVEFVQIDKDTTQVNFLGQVLPGSKLVELGEPLIQKTASKWFNRFFKRFEAVIEENNISK